MSKSVAIIGTRGYPSYYGGFETLIRRLAPYLAQSGWDVTVYGRPGSTKQDDINRDANVESIVTSGIESKSLSTLSYGLTSSLHAARNKPDVALIMNVANGYWLPAFKARGIPTVVNVDGIEWERAKWGSNAKRVFKGGAWLTARYASELICDADEIKRIWRDSYSRNGVYIPYGGDEPADLPVVDGLAKRGYVLMVARFVPENTVPEFLEAAEKICEHRDVVIVGSSGYGGPLEEKVKKLSQQTTRLTWLGHVSDDQKLFSLWQHAGIYFHGHSVGGTNPALVQAMACGAPIIARNTKYNREVLGETGLFVEPDAQSISDRILDALERPTELEALSQNARLRARKAFAWNSVCEQYKSTLESVINGGTNVREKSATR